MNEEEWDKETDDEMDRIYNEGKAAGKSEYDIGVEMASYQLRRDIDKEIILDILVGKI